jgi:hypothetical protein
MYIRVKCLKFWTNHVLLNDRCNFVQILIHMQTTQNRAQIWENCVCKRICYPAVTGSLMKIDVFKRSKQIRLIYLFWFQKLKVVEFQILVYEQLIFNQWCYLIYGLGQSIYFGVCFTHNALVSDRSNTRLYIYFTDVYN